MATEWLSREQIDSVLSELSADDLIEATDAGAGKGARIAGLAFNSAAQRVLGASDQSYTSRVRAADFRYLAESLSEAVNIDSPLSAESSALLASQEPGE